jgi:hypothetical protein
VHTHLSLINCFSYHQLADSGALDVADDCETQYTDLNDANRQLLLDDLRCAKSTAEDAELEDALKRVTDNLFAYKREVK